jgi:uncharacterized protein
MNMNKTIKSYKSPKTEIKPSSIEGKGMFAKEEIKKGEVVFIKSGHIVDKKTLDSLKDIAADSEQQLTDDFFLAPLSTEEMVETMGYINHSCEPNVGLLGNIVWVAIRNIEKGEEITIDYCTHQGNPDYQMACNCKLSNCRGIITGNDWKNKDLQDKYGKYFSSYLLERIKE